MLILFLISFSFLLGCCMGNLQFFCDKDKDKEVYKKLKDLLGD